jgi:hypothetical protein
MIPFPLEDLGIAIDTGWKLFGPQLSCQILDIHPSLSDVPAANATDGNVSAQIAV